MLTLSEGLNIPTPNPIANWSHGGYSHLPALATRANSEEWFQRFRKALDLTEKEEALVNTLDGEQADDIFSSFQLSKEDAKKYDIMKAKLDGHFVKHCNVTYKPIKFNQRCQ